MKFTFIIMAFIISCSSTKRKTFYDYNYFDASFKKTVIDSIRLYKVQHQSIVTNSGVIITDKQINLLFNCFDSLSYKGMFIAKREYALEIYTADTIYVLWGTGALIGPYKTDHVYKTPNNYEIQRIFETQ